MLQIGKYESSESEFDEDCIIIFNEIKKLILLHLPQVKVEHIGSTAIGIDGKNFIDCLIISTSTDFQPVLTKLEEIGFQLPPHKIPDTRPLRVASITHRGKKFFVHIRLTHLDSEDHRKYIYFRDYLKSNRELAKKYEELKKKIVESGKTGAKEYNKQKEDFIKSILDQI